ncbi:MAG: hypothetical protein MJE66_17430 [Proteobacteria bacterium]|nr:hypothetical protein [Pseudomonadota bacterium]
MTIGPELKEQVHKTLDAMRQGNALLVGARNGTLTHQQFLDYLNNLMYFFHHSCIHLDIAAGRARAVGQQEVVPFLEEKIREETDHARWPQSDLKKRGSRQEGVDLARVAPATHRILAYSVDLIERDPELHLAYMFFHEYITVIGGPELLADLEAHCGIPSEHVTAIGHHVELDKRHVAEDLMEIEAVVARSPHKARAYREVLDETARHADRFYTGMVSLFY